MTSYLHVLRERRKLLGNPYAFIDELDEYQSVRADRTRLENPYAHVEESAHYVRQVSRFDGISESRKERDTKTPRHPNIDIEKLVRNVQMEIWTKRRDLFGVDELDPIAILDPEIALKMLGYQVEHHDSLGQFASADGTFEVAGTIDKERHLVQVSHQAAAAVRRFTLAHELGHACLHEGVGFHRDRPLDGSSPVIDRREQEANRFATLFLMPSKQVRRAYEEMFGASPGRFDERAAFGTKPPRGADIMRVASRKVASMTNGVSSVSLATRFGVSIESMAIRLEELGLFVLSNNVQQKR